MTFELDENGIMNIKALEKTGNQSANLRITNNKARLSKEEIENLVKESERWKDVDEKIKSRIEAKNRLEGLCVSIKHTLEDEEKRKTIPEDQRGALMEKASAFRDWLS